MEQMGTTEGCPDGDRRPTSTPVSNFETVIGRIRQGLNPGATSEPANTDHAPAPAPPSRAFTTDELRAQFITALTKVDGKAIEAADEASAIDKIGELLRSLSARSVAVGEGITTDAATAAARLSRDGCQVGAIGPQDGSQGSLKERLAAVDVGIVEADYAIGATGTLVMIGDAARPRSLSLVPPINIVLLRSTRILPDLAAVLRTVGPQTAVEHPIVLVTGPSRTADIEKRIVVGVHGPKQLYVVIISEHGVAPAAAR
jgi:L-lactate dehydrogenase complex protein LldG